MSSITFGTVTVTLGDDQEFPQDAGQLTSKQLRRLVYPPKGLSQTLDEAAGCLEKSETDIQMPPSVDPDCLRHWSRQLDAIEQVSDDLRVLSHQISQAEAMLKDEAYRALRRVYGLVKSEVVFEPKLREEFKPVYDYFSVYSHKRPKSVEQTAEAMSVEISGQSTTFA